MSYETAAPNPAKLNPLIPAFSNSNYVPQANIDARGAVGENVMKRAVQVDTLANPAGFISRRAHNSVSDV